MVDWEKLHKEFDDIIDNITEEELENWCKDNSLKDDYETAVNNYIKEFEKKYDIKFDCWEANKFGETAVFGDYSFMFSNIRYIIDNNIDFDVLINTDLQLITNIIDAPLDDYCRLRRDVEEKKQNC